jgi:hypothetical protein
VITTQFINSLTEEEQGILHLILCTSLKELNYVPSFECVKFLKRNSLIQILDVLKKQILQENLLILENLQKKIIEET